MYILFLKKKEYLKEYPNRKLMMLQKQENAIRKSGWQWRMVAQDDSAEECGRNKDRTTQKKERHTD